MKRLLALTFITASALQPALAQERAGLRACQPDAARLCPGVKPGGGRIASCFKEKRDQLSEGCRAALQQAAAKRSAN